MVSRSAFPFWLLAAIGVVLAPWHMQQDGLTLPGLAAIPRADAEASSALWQHI